MISTDWNPALTDGIDPVRIPVIMNGQTVPS
jgi:hypothetical protein